MRKKEDLRITKTKRDLRSALLELLKDQPFEKITVSDVCQKAMINRMTFYKHFQDKYELLDHTINFLIENVIIKAHELVQPISGPNDIIVFCSELAKLIVEKSYRGKKLLKGLALNDSGIVNDLVINTVRKYVDMLVTEISKLKKIKYSKHIVVSFITGGLIHMYKYWLLHINEYNKEDFLAENLKMLTNAVNGGLFFDQN